MTMTLAQEIEADKFRKSLLDSMREADIFWAKIELEGGASIEVSHPYFKEGCFVPITPKELWEKAAKFKWYPLTRAVADQVHHAAIQKGSAVAYKWWPVEKDFRGFSRQLNWSTSYGTNYGAPDKVVSGAHKYWLISTWKGDPKLPTKDPKAINYGFYEMAPRTGSGPGKYLASDPNWTVRQGLGGRHGSFHWDYSQLLQFMRNFKSEGGNTDLSTALLSGHPAVWDEPDNPTRDLLPF
jgi:hypothetical protein